MALLPRYARRNVYMMWENSSWSGRRQGKEKILKEAAEREFGGYEMDLKDDKSDIGGIQYEKHQS